MKSPGEKENATEGCGSPEGQKCGVEGLQRLNDPERASVRLAQIGSAISSCSDPPPQPRFATHVQRETSCHSAHCATRPLCLVPCRDGVLRLAGGEPASRSRGGVSEQRFKGFLEWGVARALLLVRHVIT